MFFESLWLFLAYSFLGWVFETTVAAIRRQHFYNRGVINGPFCLIYGCGGLTITIFGGELHGIWLYIGSVIVATVVEWIAGHLIERWYHERWWDYSKLRFNLDGYISLQTSLFWGALGFVAAEWGTDLLLAFYRLLPSLLMRIFVLALAAVLLLDALSTILVVSERTRNPERWEETDAKITSLTNRLSRRIYRFVDRRIRRAYPYRVKVTQEKVDPTVFADGCGFYKIVMLFFVGAFLGDITETLFCRVTAGVWMSRSSVVWGPFSIVWGLAIAAVTALLYRYRKSSDSFLFLTGTFLGGAYEYVCSVFTEMAFGTVFWDYSRLPFNLGGRINLLYCFFWGIAAVVWMKGLYPPFSRWIERIPTRVGKPLTWALALFMAANVTVSAMALTRYDRRCRGVEAESGWERMMDEHYGDEVMERIYPNATRA